MTWLPGFSFGCFSRVRTSRTISSVLVAGVLAVCPGAYEGDIHQELTFIAARQYNQCAEDTHLATLTPLEVRYIAIANANQADAAWWRRMFRWNYYNRGDQSSTKFLWLFDTRMHNHYRNTLRRLEEARDLSRRFTNLGRIINYVQDATTPAHVVPVYTARWWRFSVSDRFNGFPVDADAVATALGEDCSAIRSTDMGFNNLLATTAERTINSVTESIPGLPVSWEAFWELNNDPEDFGRYGNAGNNFGREVRFPLRPSRGWPSRRTACSSRTIRYTANTPRPATSMPCRRRSPRWRSCRSASTVPRQTSSRDSRPRCLPQSARSPCGSRRCISA